MLECLTLDKILAKSRCDLYPDSWVVELFGGRDRLTLLEATYLPIPADHVVWLFTHADLLDIHSLVEFACRATERSLKKSRRVGFEPNPLSWELIAGARDFVNGKIDEKELGMIREGTLVPYRGHLFCDRAARGAIHTISSPTAADYCAFCASSGGLDSLERDAQVADLRELIRANGETRHA